MEFRLRKVRWLTRALEPLKNDAVAGALFYIKEVVK